MKKVLKHPDDENKYMSGLDDYGHGSGNGKSRQSVYKHLKKVGLMPSKPLKTNSKTQLEKDSILSDSGDDTPDRPPPLNEIDDNPEEPITDWSDFEWSVDEDDPADTIPKPIKMVAKAAQGGESAQAMFHAQQEVQGQMIRWSFMTVDRLITWWGRGVMNDKTWELVRSSNDYDVLQDTTTGVMAMYGITLPVNPWAVWGITIGSAYIPPVVHIRKNADPSRKRKWRLFGWFRKNRGSPPVDDEESNPYA